MRQHDWYMASRGLILPLLFSLTIGAAVYGGDDGETAARHRETELALQAAQERALDLQSQLVRREKELEQLRATHAQAILDLKTLRDEVVALRLTAANLLVNSDTETTGKTLAGVTQDLQELHALQQEVYRLLVDYDRSVSSALDVLGVEAEAPTRKILRSKMELVQRRWQAATRLTDTTTREEPAQMAVTTRVLTVNQTLGVVVLDAGRSQGALPGSLWKIDSKGGQATVQVIEARSSLSAAVVVAGKLSDLDPGAPAKRAASDKDNEHSGQR